MSKIFQRKKRKKRTTETNLFMKKFKARSNIMQKYREIRVARKMVNITDPLSEGTMQS